MPESVRCSHAAATSTSAPIKQAESPSGLLAALVRFTPGAHTNWHSHALGQTLHVTEGVGLVITRDGTVIRMRAGGTAWTPPGEVHWHGGSTGNVMCHIAMLEGTSDGDGTAWLDPVRDDQVRRRQRRARDAVSTRPPNHAPERDAADPEPVRPRRV
jgi:quercetin dioxygenase-like cupin family protein